MLFDAHVAPVILEGPKTRKRCDVGAMPIDRERLREWALGSGHPRGLAASPDDLRSPPRHPERARPLVAPRALPPSIPPTPRGLPEAAGGGSLSPAVRRARERCCG